jgi:hypothetical protein
LFAGEAGTDQSPGDGAGGVRFFEGEAFQICCERAWYSEREVEIMPASLQATLRSETPENGMT